MNKQQRWQTMASGVALRADSRPRRRLSLMRAAGYLAARSGYAGGEAESSIQAAAAEILQLTTGQGRDEQIGFAPLGDHHLFNLNELAPEAQSFGQDRSKSTYAYQMAALAYSLTKASGSTDSILAGLQRYARGYEELDDGTRVEFGRGLTAAQRLDIIDKVTQGAYAETNHGDLQYRDTATGRMIDNSAVGARFVEKMNNKGRQALAGQKESYWSGGSEVLQNFTNRRQELIDTHGEDHWQDHMDDNDRKLYDALSNSKRSFQDTLSGTGGAPSSTASFRNFAQELERADWLRGGSGVAGGHGHGGGHGGGH